MIYLLKYKVFEADSRLPKYRNFKDNLELRHKLLNMDKKKFNELYSKHKWYSIEGNRKDVKNNLFTLVNLAYDSIGGHPKINYPDKVVRDKDMTFWTAIDINDDPYADVVIFGRNKYGIKLSGIGHNESVRGKEELMRHMMDLLRKPGYWAEVEGVPAVVSLRKNVPVVQDIEIINKIFPNSDAHFVDESNTWYERIKHGKKVKKVMLGSPVI